MISLVSGIAILSLSRTTPSLALWERINLTYLSPLYETRSTMSPRRLERQASTLRLALVPAQCISPGLSRGSPTSSVASGAGLEPGAPRMRVLTQD